MAKPDQPDRPEVTSDSEPTPDKPDDTISENTRRARTPVRRTAPIRRGRKGTPGGSGVPSTKKQRSVESTPDESTSVETAPDEGASEEPSTPAESTNTADTTAVEPDPTEVEKRLGYRDRRRRPSSRKRANRPTSIPDDGAAASGTDTGTAVPADADTRTGAVRYRGRNSRSARLWLTGALGVVLIIACVVASVVFAVGIASADRENERRAEYSAFAKQMIVNLTTLNPENADQAMKTLQDKTSGRAQQQMQESMKQATGLIRDEKITTKSTIISDAVTKATADEGTVIVVYGWEMNSPDPKEEKVVQTFRWRVQLTRINDELKMTNFEWVT